MAADAKCKLQIIIDGSNLQPSRTPLPFLTLSFIPKFCILNLKFLLNFTQNPLQKKRTHTNPLWFLSSYPSRLCSTIRNPFIFLFYQLLHAEIMEPLAPSALPPQPPAAPLMDQSPLPILPQVQASVPVPITSNFAPSSDAAPPPPPPPPLATNNSSHPPYAQVETKTSF